MIRVVLPGHLKTLARVEGEVRIQIDGTPTQSSVLDAIESQYPVLLGAIRDAQSKKRRPFIRFFACGRDLSHDAPEDPLPEAIASGSEPYLVVGAMAGG